MYAGSKAATGNGRTKVVQRVTERCGHARRRCHWPTEGISRYGIPLTRKGRWAQDTPILPADVTSRMNEIMMDREYCDVDEGIRDNYKFPYFLS